MRGGSKIECSTFIPCTYLGVVGEWMSDGESQSGDGGGEGQRVGVQGQGLGHGSSQQIVGDGGVLNFATIAAAAVVVVVVSSVSVTSSVSVPLCLLRLSLCTTMQRQ